MMYGQRVELLQTEVSHGLTSFEIDDSTRCIGCRFRPIPENGGVNSGCVPLSIVQARIRFMDLDNPGIIEARRMKEDPTNCGVIEVLRREGCIEDPGVEEGETEIKADSKSGLGQRIGAFLRRRK